MVRNLEMYILHSKLCISKDIPLFLWYRNWYELTTQVYILINVEVWNYIIINSENIQIRQNITPC